MALTLEAARIARQEMSSLGDRWRHVKAVAAQAACLSAETHGVSPSVLRAAWLHDIGYASGAVVTGFHPLDGARFLRELGEPAEVIELVAHHTGAKFEAMERGLNGELLEAERALVGDGWPKVFRMEMGGPLRTDLPGEVMRAKIRSLDKCRPPLSSIRLHDLRRVHATLLLKAGVPVHVVAARLGHQDAAMTLRVYAHVLTDHAASAAAVFAQFMGEDEAA